MLILNIVIFIHLINIVASFILPGKVQNKFDTMKKKITDLLKGEKGSELLLDINEFEYPRANKTLQNIHEQLWHEYYNCLKKRHLDIGREKFLKPLAVIAFEGTSITYKMKIFFFF